MNERLHAWAIRSHEGAGPWLTLLFTLLSGLGIGLLSILLAVGPYGLSVFPGYVERPLILLLNLLPPILLSALFLAITGRSLPSFLLTAAVTLGFTLGNYYKLAFRDDPLLFADLLLLKEAGNMAGKYHLFLDEKLLFTLLCVVGGAVFLFFFARDRINKKPRILLAVLSLALSAALVPAYSSDKIYDIHTAYYEHIPSHWSATQQYIAHGFVYPFLHSITDAVEKPPEGYQKEEAAAILSAYTDADIPEEKKVDVIGIMLEAYNDFSRLGVPGLNEDVYAYWHQLEQEGISGNLITNIFAGGTVDTERCFVTGFSNLGAFRAPSNSYVWYFRDQGYRVEGDHPCFQWFYNRHNINQNLGYEDYRFVENYYHTISGDRPSTDKEFFGSFIPHYQELIAQNDQPYFNFSVTYQGHGPYDTERLWWGDGWVERGNLSDHDFNILNNYFGSIHDTNENLKDLTNALRESDRPVILVLFGDHNPWLGDGNSVYHNLGINLDLSTEEGFRNYYTTRYIIWANDAAKEVLGNDFTGSGPDIGPYFLMNLVFETCGWTGPAYLQANNQIAHQVPVVHTTGRYLERGAITNSLTPEGEALVRDYLNLQYYWRTHFAY